MSWRSTFVRHLVALTLPLGVLAYVATGPWGWWTLPWFGLYIAAIGLDAASWEDRHVADVPPALPFDALLVLLAGIQLLNVLIFALWVAPASLPDAVVGGVFVGMNSGFSGITVAHELVHRPGWRHQLARALLVSVLYEHFSVEHVRGHHVHVGTPRDPATARFGESFAAFRDRTIPAQLASAWAIEARRVGAEAVLDRRNLRNRVLHGALASLTLAAVILGVGGPLALVGLLVQAAMAVHLLEAVNWFEHWGLERKGKRPSVHDSWDTDSAVTLYSLVGLSRHADHHAHAARPYPLLRPSEESPKLPWGYLATGILALLWDRPVRTRLEAELRRKRLGPFADS